MSIHRFVALAAWRLIWATLFDWPVCTDHSHPIKWWFLSNADYHAVANDRNISYSQQVEPVIRQNSLLRSDKAHVVSRVDHIDPNLDESEAISHLQHIIFEFAGAITAWPPVGLAAADVGSQDRTSASVAQGVPIG